jgi:F0F1-type ATP synthase membrane subunit c/vacuolar-type H+-ATPase subunit K
MAVDQRYCVECGTRRGKPRFALADAPVAAPAATPVPQAAGGWSRLSAALAVIAVLLALGVGVLIGNSTQASLKQPVKVQVTGGALSSATGSGSRSGATTTPKSSASGGSSPKSCTKGTAGCKNGKQTGNFFGG